MLRRSQQNPDMENTNLEYRHKLIVYDMAKNVLEKGFDIWINPCDSIKLILMT